MSRTTVNFFLDLTLLVLLLLLLWCSLVVRFVFPPGASAAEWTVMGWSHGTWMTFQFAALCLLTFAILIHVMLHWNWVCGVIASYLGKSRGGKKIRISEGIRTLYGVGFLIVLLHLLGLGIAIAALTLHGPASL